MALYRADALAIVPTLGQLLLFVGLRCFVTSLHNHTNTIQVKVLTDGSIAELKVLVLLQYLHFHWGEKGKNT